MYEQPRDYLMMYDNNFIEQHIDSSDFEENCIPLVAPKNANHNLVRSKSRHKTRKHIQHHTKTEPKLYIDCDEYPVKLKKDYKIISPDITTQNNFDQKYQVKHKNKKPVSLNNGDQVATVKSKLSIMRHRIIPCISSIFKRSNNSSSKHLPVLDENRGENTRVANCCQHSTEHKQRRMRKLFKRQNYAVQPVYAIEGNIHNTAQFVSTKITGVPLQNHNRKKINNQYSSCSLSSSSECEIQNIQERQQKVKKFRNRLKSEILKEHLKYHQNRQFGTQLLQYPSKNEKPEYQVFTTPFQSKTNIPKAPPVSEGQYISQIPESSSSFWDYLFDKAGKKYQTQRVELPKPCQCTSSQKLRCCDGYCQKHLQQELPQSSVCRGRQQSPPGTNCSCNQQTKRSPQATPKEQFGTGKPFTCQDDCSVHTMTPKPSPMTVNKKAPDINKVQCKCYGKQKKQPRNLETKSQKNATQGGRWDATASNPPTGLTDAKPCQEDHDEIALSLSQKYNGEILCIHNPPCILINGCLNLPPQKEKPETSLWSVTENNRNSFLSSIKKEKLKREQSCQYQEPYKENHKNQGLDRKSEKEIQSICDQKPLCEDVRGCHKSNYDPRVKNSCIHVPMCKKIPECVMMRQTGGKYCEHRPRCPDVPICSRSYVVLTARENVGTQVKPEVKESFVCRHVPPCVMIPKCLGRAMYETYIPMDSISDCTHRPSCDMIPACCRKMTKQMVSVSCQYPNSCRIV